VVGRIVPRVAKITGVGFMNQFRPQFFFLKNYIPSYALAGFDLTTYNSASSDDSVDHAAGANFGRNLKTSK
jgi:hypothetical protein